MQRHRRETDKPIDRFVCDLAEIARSRGPLICNEGETGMAHVFGHHGVEVAADVDLHTIQTCKPDKAAMILSKTRSGRFWCPSSS